MLWDAITYLIAALAGILIDWLVGGMLPAFNKRIAGFVLFVVIGLLGFLVWNQPRDSVSMTFPTDLPLQSALKVIGESRGATVAFASECEKAMQGAMLRGGAITAPNLEQLLELAQHRLKDPHRQLRYAVIAWPEKAFYDIRC